MIEKLIGVKLRLVRGGLRSTQDGRFRGPIFIVLSLIFWVNLYRGSLWLVEQSVAVEPVGELLVQKLLSIAFLVFMALLAFSNIVSAFTTFYLADDLQFLMSKPIPKTTFFSARFLESLAQSSWIVVVFGLPIFIASGVGVGAGWEYFVLLTIVLLAFVALPTALATLISLLVTNLLKANRTRDALLFLGLIAFSALFWMVRAFRPERLLNPDSFDTIGEILDLLSAPTSAFLPSDWCMSVVVPTLFGTGGPDWWALGMLVSTPVALFFVSTWLHQRWYWRGYSKVQEGRHGQGLLQLGRDWLLKRSSKMRGDLDENIARLRARGERGLSAFRELVRKDQRVFVRDPSQWSQVLIVLAIITIYLVNYKHFEIAADEDLFGVVGLYYFNLAACGFVVVALAGRFVFPAVSVEGRSFWLILQAPISLEKFLVGKWLGTILPVLLVGQLLVWVSNILVIQNWFLMLAASALILVITIMATTMAIGLGAVYPQFHNPNAAKIASSFGAVIYMILAMMAVLFVLSCSFIVTMRIGQMIDGKTSAALQSFHFVLLAISLLTPALVSSVSIRLGAGSLRRRM